MLNIRTLTGLAAAFLLCFSGTRAQTSPAMHAADIQLQLQKLNTLGSVLYVAAHPDDENTRLLGFLAREGKYRTGYLSLTRGDGGQNLIGNEQAELLGLIRTQELMAARRIDGAEQFFTRANDFGFSKNPEETFTIWDRKKILGDVVWVIRKFRPDVIICRFPADSRAGHGHHTASAMLAAEAFKAAADPKQYPEQLKSVEVWQAKRLLWNTFNFGSNNTISEDQFKMQVGAYNALLGKGYGEIAAESRSQHKSQGFGVASGRGAATEYFQTILGDAPTKDLMDGINTTWNRVPGSNAVAQQIGDVIKAYKAEAPSASVPALLAVRKNLLALPDSYWKAQKLKETEKLIIACSGLWAEAFSSAAEVVPGGPMKSQLQIINRSNVPVRLEKVTYNGTENTSLARDLAFNEFNTIPADFNIPDQTPGSQPYWLQDPHPLGAYVIRDNNMVGYPENIPSLTATFFLRFGDQTIPLQRPFIYKFTDPVKGEVYSPLVIAPPVVAHLQNQVYIYTQAEPQAVPVKIRAMQPGVSGKVKLRLPQGFTADQPAIAFSLKEKGDETEVVFQVKPLKVNGRQLTDTMSVAVEFNGKEYTNSMTVIAYDHIPAITLFPPAEARLVTLNLQYNGRNIGYIPGAGDKVAESLQQVGYTVTILGEKEIMQGDLSSYDAIITGVRAYNTQDRLRYWQPRLLEYVKNGGTLLVQYNTNGSLVSQQLGPFPFTLSRDRVTDETAAVTFRTPQDKVMTYPNALTTADFNGWVQERGLYFPANADAQYVQPFAMKDPGEKEITGSTLVARYGKGKYVYTGLSFFRQLPAGIPGAYRLFVNLIAKQD
ncbi:PIG-L family deacetylase [Chitinophaga pollutisoli]|uniref:PIG-L family deacetylase n=1 Tax=Chitinophaga pollutisoli TaxID=3133966 RepID=A0ABZ2YPF6_9BACT